MSRSRGRSNRANRSLLAVVMLAVLAVTVGGAWLMTYRVRRRVSAGARIMREIRRRGLGEFWSDSLVIDWYLTYAGDRPDPVGWRAALRGPTGDGGFAGLSIHTYGNGYAYEQWRLNADATQGFYQAGTAAGRRRQDDTHVRLQDGGVTVWTLGDQRGDGTATAPPEYLPEGCVRLAVRRTARLGREAQFAIVYNEMINRQGRVRLGRVRLDPEAGDDEGAADRVREDAEHVYRLNADGRIEAIIAGDTRSRLVDREQVLAHFPDAALYVEALAPQALRGRQDDDEVIEEADDAEAQAGDGQE